MRATLVRAIRGVRPLVCVLLLAAVAAPGSLAGQSVLTRTPNLSGGWVGEPGAVHFNFLHRFDLVEGGDENVVVNSPTFLLAAPLPESTLLGVQYGSNSGLDAEPNEWEIFGRWMPVSADDGGPLDLSLTAAYNEAAESADGELSLAVPFGPVRVLGVARAFSDAYGGGDGGFAGGGGVSVRVTDDVTLAGDAVVASNRTARQAPAWSGGLQVRVPLTPHTLSIQASNARTATLQGASLGQQDGRGDDRVFWGFEFTIPFTFSRYFGGGGGDGGGAAAEVAPGGGEGRTAVTMTDGLRYSPSAIRIEAGQTVIWRNTTDLVHTITADPEQAARDGSVSLPDGVRPFDSGNLRPGESFAYTFEEPGEYVYFCVPHELAGMVGRVVVSP